MYGCWYLRLYKRNLIFDILDLKEIFDVIFDRLMSKND